VPNETSLTTPPLDALLREPEVKRITGLSRSQRYRMAKAGKFPAALRVGERASAWRASEIAAWLHSLQPATTVASSAEPAS